MVLSNIAIAPKVRPHYDVGSIVVYEVILCLTGSNQGFSSTQIENSNFQTYQILPSLGGFIEVSAKFRPVRLILF